MDEDAFNATKPNGTDGFSLDGNANLYSDLKSNLNRYNYVYTMT